jgi:palmitoyltransferase
MIYHFKMRWNAEIDGHDNDGRSPLHWAAYKGFPDTVRLLLFAGCHLSRPDKEGCTPLHWAAIRGKSEAAHILAQAGGASALEARDTEGSTPAQLATEKGHKSLGFFLANLQARLGKRSFWDEKGMAVVCLSLILGLVVMFVHLVVMAPGMLQMDVHAAAWSWIVVLTSGAGMYFMYRVSYADPGFLDKRGARGRRRRAREPRRFKVPKRRLRPRVFLRARRPPRRSAEPPRAVGRELEQHVHDVRDHQAVGR